MKTKLIFSILLSFSFYLLSSQVPLGFNYQAIARDGSDNPLPGPLDIKIAFLSDDDPETAIWEELHTAIIPDARGLFSIVVGQGVLQSGPANLGLIDWTISPRFIRTMIYYSGEWKNMGPAQLQSVPYSLLSKDTWTKQTLSLSGTDLSISGGNSVGLTSGTNQWQTDGTNVFRSVGNVGIGTTEPAGKLSVQPPLNSWADETPLFDVKNKYGIPVLAVYNNGVRIMVEHNDFSKSTKGGFSVGGFDYGKGSQTIDLMRITPDSIRFNINNEPSVKGAKGGFSIGGFQNGKGDINHDFMFITPQASNNGQFNTFLGYQSGYNNQSTGLYNTLIGYNAGYSNTTGQYNVSIGYQAGSNSTNAKYNTSIGFQAGQNTVAEVDLAREGSSNVFIGNSAGKNVTTGMRSVLIGMIAGLNWKIGEGNVFIGYSAGSGELDGVPGSVTGYNNTYIGNGSGMRMLTGDYNVYLGAGAGVENRYGARNVMIGGNVNYSLGGRSSTLNDNVYIGYGAAAANQTGINNVIIGSASGSLNTGSSNVFIGYQAGQNEGGSNKLYIDNSNTTSPLIYGDFTNGSEKIVINGNLGVGVSPSGHKLQVGSTGDGTDAIANAWNTFSDIRLKSNFGEIVEPVQIIKSLNGFYFNWMVGNDKSRQIGLSAQDVEKVLPEIVSKGSDGYLLVDYSKLGPVLIEAIKEQQAQIISQNEKIERLEKIVSEMQGKIASLRSQ